MKNLFLVMLVAASLTVTTASAQKNSTFHSTEYRTAVGVKFYPGAISLKHFLNDQPVALEGIGYFWRYGFRFTALAEYHGPINSVSGLKWYAGGGVHFGSWNQELLLQHYNYSVTVENNAYFGLDGVVGLDYKVNQFPINLSIDWQPSFNFGGGYYSGLQTGWGGLGIRYTFR